MDVSNEEIKEVTSLGNLVVEGGIFYPGRHKRNYVSKGEGNIEFYSGTQILQTRPFDIKFQPKNYKPASKHFVEKDWILITRSGTTGRVVMVNEQMAGKMVTEHVIRVICDEKQIDPYYVYAILASDKIGRQLLDKGIYASVVDHISPQFVSTIPIPRLSEEKEKEIADRVREAESQRARANEIMAKEIDDVENIIINAR